jgi:hypothetical protein
MRHNVSGITHFDQYFEMPRPATRIEPIRLLVGNEESVEPERSKRLLYHNTFVVQGGDAESKHKPPMQQNLIRKGIAD